MDRFHVVDQLGAGAFGRALLCRDKATKEVVVIKEIRCADKAARAEARREAELLRKHSHPNVCRYIASFADNERQRFYIVLEHCDGGDLSQAIARRRSERRPYPEAQAAALFVMVCLALRHVHARRIVHRDVKAANVFLTRRGVAKLGDFGVSRQLDASVALASTRVGTPYYSVWKSNFRRPTPSTRCCPRHRVCWMAWRFTKVSTQVLLSPGDL